jgi:hypothetical protein
MQQVKADLRAYQDALKPISQRDMAVVLETIGEWLEAFYAVPQNRLPGILKAYAQALSSMPSDLAMTAVERVKQNHRGQRIPTPGNLTAAVSDDLFQRRAEKNKLETAALTGKERETSKRTPPTPEQKARVAELMEMVRRA